MRTEKRSSPFGLGALPALGRLLAEHPGGFAAGLAIVLLIANAIVLPNSLSASSLPGDLAIIAPLALAAMAMAPPILSGGGGIDISVGPVMGMTNAVLVVTMTASVVRGIAFGLPLLVIAGALVGLVNGLIIVFVRVQPVVVTLGTYLIFAGLTVVMLPNPGGTPPGWVAALSGSIGGVVPYSVILVGVPLLLWGLLRRGVFGTTLFAVGGNDAAAFSCGINVRAVRLTAYALSGILAVLAGIALTALVGSGDPTLGPPYTIIAIAAAAFGGCSLFGGRGSMVGPLIAAIDIYLIQTLLSALNLPSSWFQFMYGLILVGFSRLTSRCSATSPSAA